ncbi:MAG: outer membrane protein assembly factor BamB family protein [Ktedonobacterales bacterium]
MLVTDTLGVASLVKLDGRDGSQKWALRDTSNGVILGNRVYVIQGSSLTAFDTATGAQVWQQHGVRFRAHDFNNIAAVAGIVYVVGQRASCRATHGSV